MQYRMNGIVAQCRQKSEAMQEKFSEKPEQVHTAYQKMAKRCHMMEQEIESDKEQARAPRKISQIFRQKRKVDEMYDQLRSEYESMERSANEPANNLFSNLHDNFDHSIDVEDLVRYAWGFELYGLADSVEDVRNQVLEAIKYLKESCLLLQDRDEDVGRKLVYVALVTLAQGLPVLASLTVYTCDELKHVFDMEKEEDGVEHHCVVILDSLQDVRLEQLKKLISFVPEYYIVKAPALKSVRAYGAASLNGVGCGGLLCTYSGYIKALFSGPIDNDGVHSGPSLDKCKLFGSRGQARNLTKRLRTMAGAFFLGAASNVIGTLMVDYVVKPIDRRIRYLFRFTKLVEDLHQQQNNLHREQSRVNEAVKEAKLQIQTKEIEEDVKKWLTDAENALEDAQSLDSRIEENKRCFRWCPDWSWRYRLSKEIEKKTKDICNLVEGSHFDRIGHRAELRVLELLPSEGIVIFKSSTAAFNKIMEGLEDDKIKMIGVWGMGGVGKTTLVKKVGDEVKGFDRVIFVTVSATPDNGKIQDKIADDIDLKFEKKSEEGKAKELWSRLKDGKFLMILDDLWNEWKEDDDLRKIGIPLVENGKGCTIILTTRRRTICKSIKCQVTIPIDVLDENEAWDLFKMKAELDERVLSMDIVEEAKKVAKECEGLPVAIVTVASALKDTQTRKGWKHAREQLESSRLIEIGNIEEKEKNAYGCIKMSFDYLKKETTKRCFLLCALYPEDHSIDVEDLVRYAWGLELYSLTESVEYVRIQVLEAIKYLKESCLLLEDGDVGRQVKLHDIVRDVALWIASKEESGFTIQSRLNGSFEHIMAISLLNNEEKTFPEKLKHSKLEMLLLNNCDVQGSCFQGMRELKVLSLTGSRKIISLYALTSLGKLRTLHLEHLEDFSFLGNLGALEILTLRMSSLRGLADELVKLENIKILDVTGCYFSSIWPRNIIGRMFKLEELYLKGKHNQRAFDDTLHEINSLPRLTALSLQVSSFHLMEDFEFPRLERYDISIPTEGRSCSIYLTEKSWEIRKTIPLNVISLLPESLESLRVLENADEFMECLIDKKLKLSNLMVLHVGNMSHISELPTQHVRVEGLVDLRIHNCPSLKLLFPLSLVPILVSLETLQIAGCHGLKQLFTELEGDGQEEEMSPTNNSHNLLCFPKLRKVDIEKCDGLEYIFPALMALQGHQELSLSISDCPQLKQVIKVENDVMLQQLQFLGSLSSFSVRHCPLLIARLKAMEAHLRYVRLSAFKGSFNRSKHLELCETIEDHNMIPKANEDGLNGLTSLEVEWCRDFECLVDTTMGTGPTTVFTHLETLRITESNGLETLCKGQPPHGFLKNLKKLDVKNCRKLQLVFQMDDLRYDGEQNQEKPLSNLQSLELFNLRELRWILKGSPHCFSLQSLKVVNIEDCEKLESLFLPSLIRSLVMLEELKIRGCHELKAFLSEPENDGEIESNTSSLPLCLPKLKILDIHWCRKLEYVGPVTLAQGLPALASLSVSSCGELKQVFSMAKKQDGVEHPGVVCLASLQDLRLEGLKMLTGFVPENYVVKAAALKSIRACQCPKVINFAIQQASKQLSLQTDGLSTFKKLSYNTDSLHLPEVRDHKILVPGADLGHLDRLTSLHIANFKGGECLVDTSEAMKGQPFLQNLKTLRIEYCYDMLEVFRIDEGLYNREENPPPLLPNLEHLQLEYLHELRWIVKGPTHCVNLQSLKILDVAGCWKLRSLSVSVVQTLASLEKLRLDRCYGLKSVFMELDGTEPDTLCLPNLKTMDIVDCPSLEYVIPHAFAPAFPRLQKLKLFNLGSLRSVVAGHDCLEAPALEILFVRRCPLLTNTTILKVGKCVPLKELTYSDDGSAESKNMKNSPSCQRSSNFESITIGNFEQLFQLQGGYFVPSPEKMELSDLIWLRNIWKGHIHVATHLKELRVYNCNSLTYIFPVMLIPHLPQLSILSIYQCQKLKQILANDDILASSLSQGPQLEKKMVFPQLKEIVLKDLPWLESFIPEGYHLEFPRLEQLDFRCYKMITNFTVDYLTLTVHAKTNQASRVDDASPSQENLFWVRLRFTSLPRYIEEAEEFSPLK
ncbi:hypothetical protein GQ457_13G004740 [Hibiscus cannabinus]